MVNLSFNQMCVLSAIANEDRYGLQIIDTVKKESGIKLILGSLYNILHKLEKDDLVTSYFGEATAERGGNRRKYYKISAKGETVLNEAQLGLINLWGGASFLKKLFPNIKLSFTKQWRFGATLLFMLLISNMPIYAASLSETLRQIIFAPVFVFFCFLVVFLLALVKKRLIDYIKKSIMEVNHLKELEDNNLLFVLSISLLTISLLTISFFTILLLAIEFGIDSGLLSFVTNLLTITIVLVSIVDRGRRILIYNFLKIFELILLKQKNDQEQNQTTSKIIRYFSYTLPSAKREEIVGDLNETVALMRKDKAPLFVICAVMSWQMTRILFAMVSVKLSDFVRDKQKEQSK